MTETIRLGTRGSLLALTQSGFIKQQLTEKIQKLKWDCQIETVLIKTQGDLQTDRPLWQLEGKDFFTKELDEALLNGSVDFVVHSYKDLGSDRPAGIRLIALPERQLAHDILLIKKTTITKLKTQKRIKIGTSSPRRTVNIKNHLKEFLPRTLQHLEIEIESLRGNVNTRVKKLQEDQYDAIVLALAGLERLALNPDSLKEMTPLLSGLGFMILPQTDFPSAASQGALALEGRAAFNERDQKIADLLKTLHHAQTEAEVQKERQAFQKYGGGCHLAVGIHVQLVQNHFLHFHRGTITGENQEAEQVQLKKIEASHIIETVQAKEGPVFLGMPLLKAKPGLADAVYDELIEKEEIPGLPTFHQHLFATSDYTFGQVQVQAQHQSLWASGSRTWKKLAALDYWVNGSSDSLGHETMVKFQHSRFLQALIPTIGDKTLWQVLTSENASVSPVGPSFPCYRYLFKMTTPEFKQKLSLARAFYWTSLNQYEAYLQSFPNALTAALVHGAGPGKTYQSLKEKYPELNLMMALSAEAFYHQIKGDQHDH